MTMTDRTPEEIAVELSQLVRELVAAGRNDLLLRAIGVSVLEELRIEAAKSRLSRLLVTKDYRIILVDYGNKEVEMTPVHKAVYLLFLNHPEGIEFKKLCEYRNELLGYYMATAKLMDKQTIAESVDMLVDPLNNSINEKCSRIKSIFLNVAKQFSGKVERKAVAECVVVSRERIYAECYVVGVLHSVGGVTLIVAHPVNAAVVVVYAVIFDKLECVECVRS